MKSNLSKRSEPHVPGFSRVILTWAPEGGGTAPPRKVKPEASVLLHSLVMRADFLVRRYLVKLFPQSILPGILKSSAKFREAGAPGVNKTYYKLTLEHRKGCNPKGHLVMFSVEMSSNLTCSEYSAVVVDIRMRLRGCTPVPLGRTPFLASICTSSICTRSVVVQVQRLLLDQHLERCPGGPL